MSKVECIWSSRTRIVFLLMAASSMRALSLANHLDVEHGVLRQQLGEYRSPRARLQLTLLVQLPVRTDYQLCPLLRRELGSRVAIDSETCVQSMKD